MADQTTVVAIPDGSDREYCLDVDGGGLYRVALTAAWITTRHREGESETLREHRESGRDISRPGLDERFRNTGWWYCARCHPRGSLRE